MDMSRFGTIAQMVYADKQPLNFARLVGELHAILAQLHGSELMFEWDYEDIAFFDLPATRIALGWDEKPGKGYSACMTVSVGPPPHIAPQLSGSDGYDGYEEACSRMVERLHGRYPALAIFWHQSEEQLTCNLFDRLVEELPPLMQLFPFQEPDWVADAMARQSPGRAVALRGAEVVNAPEPATKEAAPISQPAAKPVVENVVNPAVNQDEKGGELITLKFSGKSATARARARARVKAQAKSLAPLSEIANDHPTPLHPRDRELAQLRDALYQADADETPAPLSTQLRLTAHALNATLILVWAPLGAAVMTYSLLKGEDMKFSARLMVLTGLFATALGGPIGQQVMAISGV
ncbi:MAG: hypothetical protein V4586_09390 [Pseudomonadota bacterium]